MAGRLLLVVAVLLVSLLVAAVVAPDQFRARATTGPAMEQIAYLALIALLVSGGLIGLRRVTGAEIARNIMIWAAICAGAALLYIVFARPV